jgi:hypothetical protein
MSPEVKLLLRFLDEGFEKKAWHGPNMHGSVRGVTAAEAAWRPGPGRHNIWEIVLHAAYWKYAVRRRLSGGKRGSFALKGSNWFAAGEAEGAPRWEDAVSLLVREHAALRREVAALTAGDLGRTPPSGGKVKIEILVRGIVLHDIYHAGQIQLIKRMKRK